RLVIGIVEGAKTHHGPSGLACGARAFTLEDGVVVSVASFAPAAVLVLHAFQPVPGLLQPGLIHVDAQGAQATQDLPRAVDVIDAPTAIPRAVLLLVVAEVLESF